jgi:predicted DNA-binding transcriptional regulator AlpA
MEPNRFLTTRETADFIGVSVSTLNRMRRASIGPRCTRINAHTYRYRMSEIELWLRSQSDRSVQHSGLSDGDHLRLVEGVSQCR